MDIQPIKTEANYDSAMERIDALFDADFGTPEGDELDVLTTLVEAYEQAHFAIEAPDPVEFLKNTMEFIGLEQKGLAAVLNSRSRASEILNRQRPLTLENIRRITSAWEIPADPLIRKYKVAHGT